MPESPKSINTLSSILVFILHPYFVCSLGMLIIFNTNTIYSYYSDAIKNYVHYITIGITCVIPFILLSVIPVFKNLFNINISEKQKRLLPIALGTFVNYYAYTILKEHSVLFLINSFFLSIIIFNILFLLISYFIKTSFQLGMYGSLLALILKINIDTQSSYYPMFFFGLISISLLASSLLYKKKISSPSLYLSFFAGFLITLLFTFAS